jgi:hypothetical protein
VATTVEITPVIRQATCGPDGTARLIFLVTNIQERTADIIVGIAQDQGIDANWFEIEDGADRKLAPKSTARIIVIAKLPPGTAPGRYKFRLEVSEPEKTTRIDRSPSVELNVETEIEGEGPQAPKPKAKTRWWSWAKFWGLLSWPFRQIWRFAKFLAWPLRALFARFGGKEGKASGGKSRDLNLSFVIKGLGLFAIIYVLSLAGNAARDTPRNPTNSVLTGTMFYKIFISEQSTRLGRNYNGPKNICGWF